MKIKLHFLVLAILFFQSYIGRSQTPALVKDIYSGTTSSMSGLYGIMFGSTYVFDAEDASHGRELWKTDGTTAGTILIKDIYPGSTASDPSYFTIVNGVLYFTAEDGTHGRELWKSDGTTAGTVLVKDITSGTWSGFEQNCCGSFGFYVVWQHNGSFFFVANDMMNTFNDNIELWKSDGTTAGTVKVKDIYAGSTGSYPHDFVEFNNKLFFQADDGVHGSELWTSDGTSAGTLLLKDIYTGINSGFSQNCCGSFSFTDVWEHGGSLFFEACDFSNSSVDNVELWKTDGTTAGTVRVKDIYSGNTGSYPHDFKEFNGALLFIANDGTHGIELWKSDGSDAGTTLVKDIKTGTASGFSQNCCGDFSFYDVWEHGGSLFFEACDFSNASADNVELWKTDGTTAGTVRVKDIYPGNTGSYPHDFTNFNGTLLFIADDGTHGTELWKLDGSDAGTIMIKDIKTGSASGFSQNCCGDFGFYDVWEHGGSVFFEACDVSTASADNVELWKTDGTTAGTVMVKDVYPGNTGSYPGGFTAFGNQLFFSSNDGTHGNELWKTDGSTAGTSLVKDIQTGSGSGIDYSLSRIFEYGSSFYFKADQNTSTDDEIWKTDGTTAGTTEVLDIYAGSNGSYASTFIQLPNDYLIFSATDATHGTELWSMYLPGIVAVNEISKKDFLVFPNPVSDGRLTIRTGQANGDLNVKLFDFNGREVYFKTIQSEDNVSDYPLQLPLLPTGIYFLQMSDEKSFYHSVKIAIAD